MISMVDRLTEWLGRAVSLLGGAMVLVTVVVVVLRYGFDIGAIALQESVTYMHGVLFLVGLGYTLKHDAHVRVDLLYGRASDRRRDWTNLVGHLLFMVPLTLTIIIVSASYVSKSWTILEGSPEVGGIPAVFLLKTMIPLGAGLLLLQTLAEISKTLNRLRRTDG